MSPFVGIILIKAWIFMSSQISYKDNKNRIKKKLSFYEGGHQLEKLEFALAIAQTNGDEKKSIEDLLKIQRNKKIKFQRFED